MDFDRLRFVSERADSSEKMLSVTIPEQPGSFRTLYSLIWPRNVTEFSYRFESTSEANVLISFQPLLTNVIGNKDNDFENVMDGLKQFGFKCFDISNSELAKDHVRHMAGGRSCVKHERLFRFDFPEVKYIYMHILYICFYYCISKKSHIFLSYSSKPYTT